MDSTEHNGGISRRGAMTMLGAGAGALALGSCIPSLSFDRQPVQTNLVPDAGGRLTLSLADPLLANLASVGGSVDLAVPTITQTVDACGGGEKSPVIVHRLAQGSFVAYLNRCTHLGGKFAFDGASQNFLCPCHGAQFVVGDGSVAMGPAVDPLPAYPVTYDSVANTLTISNLPPG